MKSFISLLFLVTTVFPVFGATYIPLPIESQLQKSYGVVEGTYEGSSYKKLPNGDVVTLASFHVDKHVGIKTSDIKNNFDFKVTLPGGVWDDLTYFVSGVPNFKKGERVVLLVSRGKYGMYLSNLGLGKYKLLKKDDGPYLVSEVFPNHPTLGKIPYNEFNAAVVQKFGASLQNYTIDKYVYKKPIKDQKVISDKSRTRIPASSEGEDEKNPFTPVFLVLVLAGIGAYGTFLMRDK